MDIGDWFRSVPFITRYWFAGSILMPLIGKLGLISPAYLHDCFERSAGAGAEMAALGAFDGRPADYVYMLLFNWICIVITGLMMNMQLLMIPLIMSVLYVWAQMNRDMIVSFWFGTRFKACYLPWVILGFNYIIGGSAVNELIGNLVGHLYFFLMFKYPVDLGGRSFLSTPEILYQWFPNRRGGVSGFGVQPTRRRAPQEQAGGGGGGGRHNWGQGFRLGED
ncbi:hypothetical protein HF521_017171 [Silurus meridionalis]|uniref:Derlin n=1 Tax=Silurus meridionalis TaxID=175797 RepID=A0A8T0BM67_SILME|nr:hypothetical protein HF521_017171 [Silurus meridionalis]